MHSIQSRSCRNLTDLFQKARDDIPQDDSDLKQTFTSK